MVVNTVLRHWVGGVAGEGVGPDGFGGVVGHMVTFLYADDGLLASTKRSGSSRRLMCLTTNVGKTVMMVCQPCQSVEGHLSEAYKIRMTGVRMIYRT